MSKDMDRPFLVGEKIYLRPFDVDDIEVDYIQWVNDSEIIGHLASNAFPKTKSELVDFVNDVLNNKNPKHITLFSMISKDKLKILYYKKNVTSLGIQYFRYFGYFCIFMFFVPRPSIASDPPLRGSF